MPWSMRNTANRMLLLLALATETVSFQITPSVRVGRHAQLAMQPAVRGRGNQHGFVAAHMRDRHTPRKSAYAASQLAETSTSSQSAETSAIVQYPDGTLMKIVCDGRNMCVLEEVDPEDDGKPKSSKLSFWIPRLLILGCCMIYGSNFAFGRLLLDTAPASVVSGLRFSLAGLALAPFLARLDRQLIKPGLVIGLLLAFGYMGQSMALTTVAAGKVGFFCALSVLVCPLLEVLFDGKKMSWGLVGSAVLALIGVGLMELSHGMLPGVGDLWALAQPLGFGTAYWLTAKTLQKHPKQTLALTALQTSVVGGVALLWMLGTAAASGALLSGAFLAPVLASPGALLALAYCGLFSTAFARIGETRALGKLSSSEASVLMATEPLWAAVFAALLVSEVVTLSAIQGGMLIMLACVLSTAEKGIASAGQRLRVLGQGGVQRIVRIGSRFGWLGAGS